MQQWTALLGIAAAFLANFAQAVLDVTPADLVSAIQSSEAALVLFHASYCGHSRQFSPDFSYAGDLLEEATGGRTRVFRVDVGHNASFAEQFGVRGFPSVKFFHRGDVASGGVAYDGVSATPIAIKTWTLKQLNQLAELKTREDALQLLKRAPFAVVTFFAKPDHDFFFSEYTHLSRTTPDMEFAFTCNREISDLLNVPSSEGFVLYHPHDAGFSVYSGSMEDLDAMHLFIKRRRLPLVAKLDHANPEVVVNDGRHIFLMLLPETSGTGVVEEFNNFARLHQSKRHDFLFLISGRREPVEARLLEYIGDFSDSDQVQYWLIQNFNSAGDMKKFRCVSLHACFENFEAGNLLRFIKSEPPVLSHPAISDLQGFQFKQQISDSSHDHPVLVFFLTSWCSACHRFNDFYENPDFVEFAKTAHGNITLARIDVGTNDTPGLSVLNYPALRLLRGPGNFLAFDGSFENADQVKTWLARAFGL